VSDYVVDASAVVAALGRRDAAGIALRSRIRQASCHAPHVIDVEVGETLRRGLRRAEITEETARTALWALASLVDHRYPHPGRMSNLAWELCDVVSFYDGLYVALATMLDLPLLTSDIKLTKAPGLPCRFELIM
jgi:predicted nucleic acid-binding protein